MKMYGVTWFNYNAAIDWYFKAKLYLSSKVEIESTGYFHEIVFNNFDSYSNSFYDLGKNALSFNDYEEYSKCLEFKKS